MLYFKLSEFDCKCGCGLNRMDSVHLAMLEEAREIADVPFMISSGTRCEEHNNAIGGVMGSSHVHGYASDIKCVNSRYRFKIVTALLKAGFNRIEIKNTWIHADNDPSKDVDVIFLK